MARISRRAMRDRVVAYLRSAAELEENREFWDDYCIAWMTVAKSAQGEKSPHFWATYEHLGAAPEQVHEMVLGNRRSKLGANYVLWYDQAGNLKPDAPKKPVESAGMEVVSKNQKRREC